MTTTPYLHLTMDDEDTDLYSVERVNANTQKIDNFAAQTASQLSQIQAAVESLGSGIRQLNAALTALTARVEALEGGGS